MLDSAIFNLLPILPDSLLILCSPFKLTLTPPCSFFFVNVAAKFGKLMQVDEL